MALGTPYRAQPLRGLAICLIAAAICASLPFFEHAELYALVATLLFCVTAPGWFEWQRGRFDYFEPVHLIGLVYFVYFGLGALWTIGNPSEVAYDMYIVPYLTQATLYVLLGYLALLVGYYLPWQKRAARSGLAEKPRGTPFLLFCGGVGFGGMMAGVILERASVYRAAIPLEGIVRPLSQLSPLFLFAWAFSWLLHFSRGATRTQRLVLFLFLLPCTLTTAYFTFSNKTILLTLAGIPIAAMWYGRRKIPWISLITLFLVLLFIVFPFYNTYRNTNKYLEHSRRIGETYTIVRDWDRHDFMQGSFGLFKRRMALVNSVAVVVRDVGTWVPYAKGQTLFMPFVDAFIPRALRPEKPPLSGRQFAELFRVVHITDRETYIAASIPGELCWNFGLPGIVIGMGLLGFGSRFLYRRYIEAGGFDPLRKSFYIVVATQLVNLDGGLAGSLVFVIRSLIVMEALRYGARYYGFLEPASPSDSA